MSHKLKLIEAEKRLALFRKRFESFGDDYPPVQVAQMWRDALKRDLVDSNAVSDIIRYALKMRNDFDIVYAAFCNSLEKYQKELDGNSESPPK